MFKIDEDIPYINKPWGYERIFTENQHYVGKYIFIEAGHRTSRQYHQTKEETIYVLGGPFHIEIGPDDKSSDIAAIGMAAGESYHIEPGVIHRFCAPEDNHVELIEVGTNHPQDIVRLEDDYDRFPGADA